MISRLMIFLRRGRRFLALIIATIFFVTGSVSVAAGPADFECGDANGDGTVNIGDVVRGFSYAFKCVTEKCGYAPPPPIERADANCDGKINVGDAACNLNYIFRHGPAPCCRSMGQMAAHTECKPLPRSGHDWQILTQDCINYQYDGIGSLTVVHSNAGLNCCPVHYQAIVRVRADTILINETTIPGTCRCYCLYDLNYQIVYLPPGQYTMVISEQCLITGDALLTSDIDLSAATVGSFCVERDHDPW